MIIRVSDDPPEGNLPGRCDPETSDHSLNGKVHLLSIRAAAILGTSFLIAVTAGALTYLALGRSAASLPSGILAAGAAFAGAIRMLNSIIA